MNWLRSLVLLVVVVFLGVSCEEKPMPQEVDKPEPEAVGFEIEILDLHSSHCKVRVNPADKTSPYFCGVATQEYLSTFGSMDDMMTTATNFIETTILENGDVPVSELMKSGVYEREVTGLQPEMTFVVFACHTDETGAVVSDVTVVVATTPALEASQNTFEIEVDQITATSAMLFITPSNDDDYVWLEFPDYIYEGMTMEELEAFLLQNYKPFFPLHTNSGEMVHSFDDALEPDTEYMIIVFGYDGGLTTPLTTKKFRTLEPNDPSNTTFSFEYGAMTARSVTVTFKPSDVSVAYLAIVADEDMLEKKGGVNADGVKALIDSQIKKAIALGDCEDRAEFASYYAQRGKKTGNFALTPGMKHYACAVCVDAEGNYASEVAIDEFTAPAEGKTDASVTASVLKYFDGDALALLDSSLYGEYAGWAVVRIRFALENSASSAIYTIYPASILEEEGVTEEDIRGLLLDNELSGVYNFYCESLTDVLLEWGCDYKLYAIPFDENENTGELICLDIPALSKDGASSIVDF